MSIRNPFVAPFGPTPSPAVALAAAAAPAPAKQAPVPLEPEVGMKVTFQKRQDVIAEVGASYILLESGHRWPRRLFVLRWTEVA